MSQEFNLKAKKVYNDSGEISGGGGSQIGARIRIPGLLSGFGTTALIPYTSGDAEFDTSSMVVTNGFQIPSTGIYQVCFYCYSPTNSSFVTAYYKLNSNDPTGSIGFAPTIPGGGGYFATTTTAMHFSLTASDIIYFFAYAPQGQIGNIQISVVKA